MTNPQGDSCEQLGSSGAFHSDVPVQATQPCRTGGFSG